MEENVCPFESVREGEETVLKFDCRNCPYSPSVEDNKSCMKNVLRALGETELATKIIMNKHRDYEYDFHQTLMLTEIVKLYIKFQKNKNLTSFLAISKELGNPYREVSDNFVEFRKIIIEYLLEDPIGAYVRLLRQSRELKILHKGTEDDQKAKYLLELIQKFDLVISELKKTRLIISASPYLAGIQIGDRSVYRNILNPTVKPDFMYTKLMATYPKDALAVDSYELPDGTEVTIFEEPSSIQKMYHIIPPEFRLSEEKYSILETARNIISEHKPKKSEFVDPKRMREIFFHIGKGLIEELSEYKHLNFTEGEIDEIAKILVRYTVGFGLIEVVMGDSKIQDLVVNSPQGRTPIFLIHEQYHECTTNIIATVNETESWASKLRMISGRPLDEANPILDTDVALESSRARVAVISAPLNPTGLAYAFRRHRDRPWTLPLFIKARMINPLAAGIISFLIDGARTILVAGTRSAGKSSFLGSMMTEIMRTLRIITIEDTLELPTDSLRDLNYNIQSMKVAAALTKNSSEVPADEGIRTTLRLGDSCLIVGEVRSTEAKALYEAMRVGALANVVAGTIHGDSPYGVFDRVVNDLQVPKTSFKATDIIIVANPIKSADGLHKWRRITQITEVRKNWEQDPLTENGFVDIMKYDSKKDELVPSDDLIHGDSEILKSIASNVKEWAGNWDALWSNIILRAKIKEEIVNISDKLDNPNLLEADFVILANDEFHRCSDYVLSKHGKLDSDKIFQRWSDWLTEEVKKSKWKMKISQ